MSSAAKTFGVFAIILTAFVFISLGVEAGPNGLDTNSRLLDGLRPF